MQAGARRFSIASHAFFLPENGAALARRRNTRADPWCSRPTRCRDRHCARANLSRPRPRHFTALEASTLNLWGTKLVTLSACDTGIGDVKNGEGVYGLRRGFFLAGAETIVMSLWPVSDYVTHGVMTKYYAGLARGEGRGAALRRVQLAMIADSSRRHPFYWAGFIQAGDWRPLRRH